MIELINKMNNEHHINKEDILFVLLSKHGVNVDLPYSRIRFLFSPKDDGLFHCSGEMQISQFFLALPVNPESPFFIDEKSETLSLNDRVLGTISELYNDTCDTHYTRNEGKVINLNPVSKSNCHGCKFCHTIVQNANDTTMCIKSANELEDFFKEFIQERDLQDLGTIIQIALVTGGFESERELIDYIKMISFVAKKYNFNGEILYFGAELTEIGLEALKDLQTKLVYCYTLECFTQREKMLKRVKAEKTIDEIIKLYVRAAELGITTTFSYVLGMDPLEVIQENFDLLSKYISRFPIVNVYQPHRGVDNSILDNEANQLNYYLEAREQIEDVFIKTNLRPRPWENYRSLWYLSFGQETLLGSRRP